MSNSYFRFKRFTVCQERCAMKVGTDGTLLGAWACVPAGRSRPRVLDVGTGTGLMALMMAQRFADAAVTGIDIDEGAVSQARDNASASPFADRIHIELTAVQDVEGTATYDAIVCNPPYFIDSLRCPDDRRNTARHADTLTYDALMTASARLLADGGEVSVVIPADSRTAMDSAAAIAGLHPRRACHVKTTERKPPKRVMLSYTKGRNSGYEEATMVIGDGEYRRMTADFYLDKSKTTLQ